jgi:hypothetical protein
VEASLYQDSYTFQSFVPAIPWSTAATATPIKNFRSLKVSFRGFGAQFGSEATFFANSTTMNALLNNENNADLFGRRQQGLSTINNIQAVGDLFMGDNLPKLVEYDRGYKDDAGVFRTYLPDGVGVLIGRREGGQKVGEYQMTRNVANGNFEPGATMKVIDNFDAGDGLPPRQLVVYDGHNGGPSVHYPGSIVTMTGLIAA